MSTADPALLWPSTPIADFPMLAKYFSAEKISSACKIKHLVSGSIVPFLAQ
jgi:hypothetical protein